MNPFCVPLRFLRFETFPTKSLAFHELYVLLLFMSGQTSERRLEMLGEFAEMMLASARDLHAAQLAASDVAEKARLADSLHRTGRGLRQTLALQAKLERDQKRGLLEDAAAATLAGKVRIARRKAQARAAIARLVWTEYEPDDTDAEDILGRLDHILAAEAELDDFLTEDPDAQFTRLCDAIDFDPPDPPLRGRCPGGAEGVSSPESAAPNPLSRSATAPPEGEHLDPSG